ncbi:MAG: endonuclease MutS2 [Chloroflexi bacterium]|nr:endonuclease MutS2 [Chloroflexota bacterium]
MTPKYLRVLEFDKICARVAAHTAFSASADLARALSPATEPADIARGQAETTEARALIDQNSEISVGSARDVRSFTKSARIGALLQPVDLLDLRQTLIAARTLRRALARLGALYPRLAERAAPIAELPVVTDAIARAINDRAEVADHASDELARIRRELHAQRARLMDKLQRLIGASSNAKIIQEAIITERDGRYVIPIRAEAKGKIPGIVHDTSASGATIFIEPIAAVEMGNRVRELERAEAREVERILRELTARVAAHAEPIDANVAILAAIDLAFAKAKYSAEINGVAPVIASPEGAKQSPNRNLEIASSQKTLLAMTPLQLLDARHPLLDPQTVVPITVRLGGEFSILIITGPNTGGKTVTLKTVGLLALMAQSGLHIPACAGSRLPIFTGVYADIGDEQSIEQSLSTFSSHLKNIVEILREADARSLVLLDELGAGTDPVEGSALARAILTHLLDRKIPALVATHYAELKAFAHTTPGVQNASMEFDVETLSPTYHLTIGLPGQSNAFAIAARLGLDAPIIAQARNTLARSDVELETMLAQIKRAQQDAASAQAHAEIAQRDAEQRAADARRKLAEIESTRAEILERAHGEAQAEIQLAREELNRLRQEWRAVSLARAFVENEQTKLDELAAQLPTPPPAKTAAPVSLPLAPGAVGIGDQVWVARLGQRGQVIALDANGAEVQVGNFRVRVKLDELGERIAAPESAREKSASQVSLPDAESPGVEVSLRGLRADDALDALEKYLDRAYLAGLPYVRVVHGKGTGTLRKLARDLLRAHPLVASLREADAHEGGDGVTVVKLVSR